MRRHLGTVSAAFERASRQWRLLADASQLRAVRRLDEYGESLRLAARSGSRPLRPWAYLWGDVGSGKTMLLDLVHAEWRDGGPVSDGRGALRAHYHDFMLEAHAQLHTLQQGREPLVRQCDDGREVYSFDASDEHADTMASVARTLAQRYWLVCLDELHVGDAADAALLSALAAHLLRCDAALVVTSNQPPRGLYASAGAERERHVGALGALLAARCVEVRVGAAAGSGAALEAGEAAGGGGGGNSGGGVDYRGACGGARRAARARSALLGEAVAFEAAWAAAAAGAPPGAAAVRVAFGRELRVRAAGGAARLAFGELCAAQRGAADFLALARAFDVVFVGGVPPLAGAAEGGAAEGAQHRLMTLVDVAYDEGCGLVLDCSAVPADADADEARREWAAAQGLPPPRRRRAPAASAAGWGTSGGGTPLERLFGGRADGPPRGGLDEGGWRVRRCRSRLTEMTAAEATASCD